MLSPAAPETASSEYTSVTLKPGGNTFFLSLIESIVRKQATPPSFDENSLVCFVELVLLQC